MDGTTMDAAPRAPHSANGVEHHDDAVSEVPGIAPNLGAAFHTLIDRDMGVIGRVVGSEREPAGNQSFAIWADRAALTLDVGHIVVAFSEEAAVIGVVDEPRRYSDVQSFLDDYFDRLVEQEGALFAAHATLRPEILVFTVRTLATKHLRDDVESHRPPVAGPVWYATEAAIRYALDDREEGDSGGFTGFRIPALLHTNGNYARDERGEIILDERGRETFQRTPIVLDSDYLMGPEAGHGNWTGQSGLATKTSHVIFLIGSAFQRMRAENHKVAALMFNVKGSDLLWLDKPAQPDDPELVEAYRATKARLLREQDLRDYGAFGLTPEPFSNFRIFAPFRPQMEPGSAQDEQSKRVLLAPLGGGRGRLRLNTYRNGPMASGCVFPIAWTIGDFLWMPHRVFDRADLDDKLFGLVDELRHLKPASLDEAIGLLDEGIKESEIHPQGTWNGHHRSTIIKLKNRLRGLKSKFGGLLCDVALDFSGANKVDDSFTDQELRVVDIAHCNTNVQEVLVTAVIHEIWKKAELGTLGVDKLIVFVDELNKYAPAGGEGALRDILVDIAARGRHLNVVLFGAQQFRSKVDGEILGNCGTAFYGRVGDEEIVNAAYRSLSETVKSELLGLPKGRLLVRHAHFRAPLFGIFPMPPTVAGTVGQKVFNGDGALTTQHPGDPLWMLLKQLMGAKAPQKNEVRRACEGCDPGAVLTIGQKIESMAARATHERFDPWRTAQGQLRLLRTQGGGGAPF